MIGKPLPTGEEPPSGYELLYDEMRSDNSPKVNRVSASQLSVAETSQLERLRKKAFEPVRDKAQNRDFEFTLDRELNLWPKDKALTDKLIFCEYFEGQLRGYALVVRGWPNVSTWTIQHLIIDPQFRLQGVGKRIVEAIEADALTTTESTNQIVAVPITATNDGFWEYNGYVSDGSREISIDSHKFSIDICQKSIR